VDAIGSYFVNDVVALARDASMSSSYKPALLKAIVRIVRRGGETQVALRTIGAEFVALYWVQTVVFRLRQEATVTSKTEVVRRIQSTAELAGVRNLADLPSTTRARLDAEMAAVLPTNVLDAFHRSRPAAMQPLYTWFKPDKFITMSDESHAFISKNAQALESIANLWWARYLERVNLLTPLVIEKVERDGAKRSSLARYLKILRQTDEHRCFYCCRIFEESGKGVHVDHVIPWSFLLTDRLWDLVLSCAPCNLAKSDSLPDRKYLAELIKTNARRSRITLPPGIGSPILDSGEIERIFDAAVSEKWPSGWAPALLGGQRAPTSGADF
jgi:hypothetical protein